ncbi:MAG: sensor domain-containing diguanylate cyclase [Candidatus Gastranaerophilales bacterium]|nr:sensor domain-containing diguanylate cyclase [Candidatus Gastranaerophilales bacterium]MCM1072668.1 sensor domain-containing diguanylate cyclase [Bacteroides sp.]
MNSKLHFLNKTADILIKELDAYELVTELKTVINTYINLKDLNIYVFDPNTSTLRNYAQNWCVIDEVLQCDLKDTIYHAYEEIHGNDFVINNKAFKLPQTIGEISFKLQSLFMPIVKNGMVFGIIELVFDEDTSIDMEDLFLMKILGTQISLKLQNIVLNEQSQINVEFHDSMKNIAKIIETQYEINYIVPLIGEMLDRFISDHLIYVFLKQGEEFSLVWPKACNDERVFDVLKQVDNDYGYILTNDDKIGAFPLVSEDEVTGCIVARSMIEKLSKRDIDYLEQLTRQAAATINRANTYSTILQYATLDALTNLNNRRQFETRLGQEISITKRQNNPLCAMMVDIDFFKKVNDTYGHAAGDEVLRTVASIIKEQLRESDIPARYGGEEFAVLLPFTKIEEAQIVGERLRKAVEAHPVTVDNVEIAVTISMGLAEYNKIESGEELFERADKALYEAKKGGRNRVCVA